MPIASRKTTASKATKAAPRKAATKAVAAAVEEVAAEGLDFTAFLTELRTLVDSYLTPIGTVAPKGRGKATKAAAAPVEEPEDDTEAEEDAEGEEELPSRAEREAELKKLTVRALRKLLVETGEFEEDQVKDETDKDVLIEGLLDYELEEGKLAPDDDEDEEAAEEDAEEDADDEETEEVDRDTLLAMNLRELKKLAVEQYSIDAGEVKTADKDTIIDMILEEGDDDEGDEEEAEEDADADEYWTEEELTDMPIAEVRGIADDAGIKYTVKQGKDKAALIAMIVE